MSTLTLLKVGGAELQPGQAIEAFSQALAAHWPNGALVVVHGGGPDIASLQARLGLEPRFVEGLRVTDEASLEVAEMVLSGMVNKRLVAALVQQGLPAVGLSGVDGGLLRAVKLRHSAGDLGRVGEIVATKTGILDDLMDRGYVPIVSPISLGQDGRPFNVNADHAALAIAQALGAGEAVFCSNVPGVLDEGALLPHLSADEVEPLIASGVISGGMIPKVRSAVAAIAGGVGAVRITDLAGLTDGGTRISN